MAQSLDWIHPCGPPCRENCNEEGQKQRNPHGFEHIHAAQLCGQMVDAADGWIPDLSARQVIDQTKNRINA